MKSIKQFCRIGIIFIAMLVVLTPTLTAQDDERTFPETVMATFRVKPDQIDAFLKMMPDYWAALRTDNLVMADPHILLRGTENGKPIVVEILTWKTHDAPDHAPADIQSYWSKMNAMVEDRDGHSGIEFPEITIVKSHP